MKKNGFILRLLCLVFLIASTCSIGAAFEKTKIAVLDFEQQGDGYETADMGKIVAEWLITAFVKDGRFEVIERRLLTRILDEQDLHMTGLVDKNSTTEVGKLLGVNAIILGSVTKLKDIMEVNARIIDVETASVIAAERINSDTAVRLHEYIDQMAARIIRNFPHRGYIVARNKSGVSIDLGKVAGVKHGVLFDVYKEGNPIKHPKTGKILDVMKIRTGIIEITKVGKNISEARILKENVPNTIEYGQMIMSSAAPLEQEKGKKLTGRWDAYMKKPSKSSFFQKKDYFVQWSYSVPEINDDTYAGLDLYINPVSVKGRNILIKMESQQGFPVYIRLYSFMPGFSKDEDEDTFVPVEMKVSLKAGFQEVFLDPSSLHTPNWWRAEYNVPVDISFNPEDVRMIEFDAEVDEELGPVSDEIRVNAIILQ